MKNAKKLLGMVLSLCLVLSLLAGFTATAAGEKNLLDFAEGGWGTTVGAGDITPAAEFAFTTELMSIYTPYIPVEQNATYTVNFGLKLKIGQMQYRIFGYDENNAEVWKTNWSAKMPLSGGTEYINMTIPFTVEGEDMENVAKISFRWYAEKQSATADADTARINNISVAKVGNKAINGSFEAVDGAGNVVGAAGMVVTDSDATPVFDGERMMVATKDSPVTLDLTLPEYSENAKLRGYIKADGFGTGSKATLTAKTAGGRVLAEKSFNTDSADTIWDITEGTWEYVRMSALPYSSGMELEISVTGEGSLYADGFTFEKDNNLLKNASFIPDGATIGNNTNWTWRSEHTSLSLLITGASGKYTYLGDSHTDATTGEVTKVAKIDGNCPDGQNYLFAEGCNGLGNTAIVTTATNVTLEEGKKYRFSLWIKSNVGARIFYNTTSANTDTSGVSTALQAAYTNTGSEKNSLYFFADAKTTNGEWQQIEYTFTVPKGLTVTNLRLASQAKLTEGQYIAFNMPSIEKIEESEVNFYTQEYKAYYTDKPVGAFLNVTGEPLETAVGLSGTITAIATTVTPYVTSEDIVIIAAYKEADGKKQLVHVTVGEKAAAPAADTTGVIDKADANIKYDGVTYPTATVSTDDLGDATEICAFLWDGVSGLKPAGNYATLTK